MEIEGDARTILSVERTVLNIIMRMSGISTILQSLLMMSERLTRIS